MTNIFKQTGLAVLALILLSAGLMGQRLDDSWTVTVYGQPVQVNADGTFVIPNVSVPDRTGSQGPGAGPVGGNGPDFLGDDFLQMRGYKVLPDGTTLYAFSEVFELDARFPYRIQDLTISDAPPVSVVQLFVTSSVAELTPFKTSAQLTVMAELSDGSMQDLTNRSNFTVYRSTNTNIARVGPNGLVTGIGCGPVFITVVNDAVTAVIGLEVNVNDPGTDISGFVFDASGGPVAGADVRIPNRGFSAVTGADGRYEIIGAPSLEGSLSVYAQATVGGQRQSGFVADIIPIGEGTSDGGIITLAPFRGAAVAGAGTETLRFVDLNAPLAYDFRPLGGAINVDRLPIPDRVAVTRFFPVNAGIIEIYDTSSLAPALVGSITMPFGSNDATEDIDISCASDGRAMISGGGATDGTTFPDEVYLVDTLNPQILDSLLLTNDATTVAITPDGTLAVAGSFYGNVLEVISIDAFGQMTATGQVEPSAGPINISASPDGSTIAVLNSDGIQFYEVVGSTLVPGQVITGFLANSLVFTSDSQSLYLYDRSESLVQEYNRNGIGVWLPGANLNLAETSPNASFYFGVDEIDISSDDATLAVHTYVDGVIAIDRATMTISSTTPLDLNDLGGGLAIF